MMNYNVKTIFSLYGFFEFCLSIVSVNNIHCPVGSKCFPAKAFRHKR